MTKNYQTSRSNNYTRHLIKGNVTGNLGINSAYRFAAIYGEGVDRLQVLKKLHKENVFRFWWFLLTGLAVFVSLFFNLHDWVAIVSCLEVYVILVNFDLVARGKVIGVYVGILDCLIYILVAVFSGLWGEVIKYVTINIPLNIYIIFSWNKNIKAQNKNKSSAKTDTIEIKKLSWKGYLAYIALFVCSCVPGYFLLKYLGTTSLIISTISFSIGIIAKIMSGQRYMEYYVVSTIGNLVVVALWLSTYITTGSMSAIPQIICYISATTNSIYCYFLWKGMYKQSKYNGGKILSKRPIKIKRVIKLRRMYKDLYWDKERDIKHFNV